MSVLAVKSVVDCCYCRGASIEQLVHIITNNYLLLWGGAELGNKDKWIVAMGICSEEQLLEEIIIDFFLTTYRSFMEPIILLRLLLHRLVTIGYHVNKHYCLALEQQLLVMITLHHTSQSIALNHLG